MRTFLKTLFTEDEADQVWCLFRIALGLGVFTFIGLSIWHVIANHAAFDGMNFGTGFGALVGGAGTGVFMNGRSDPK